MKTVSRKLYGETLKLESLGGFTFSETAYSENVKLPFHSHDFSYFCFVLKGDFTEIQGQKESLCQNSTIIYHPSGERHADHFHTPSRCFNFQLNPRVLELVKDLGSIPRNNIAQKSNELSSLVTRLYKEVHSIDEYSVLTVEGLALEVTAEFFRQSNRGQSTVLVPRWLLRVKDFISEESSNNLTISSIATVADVHPTHLAREFRRYFNITIGDFLRQKRVESACRKIAYSDTPLSEIAIESGFFDQSHLTRVFKKAIGMTPAVYRKTFRTR